MRGSDEKAGALFCFVDLESRVLKDHPLHKIRRLVNDALSALEGQFSALYSGLARPSIAPETLLRAMLLQAFFSIRYSTRSERHLMERLEFGLLFRWFVGLWIDDAVWDHSSFSKNRDRLLEGDIPGKFLAAVLAQPRVRKLLSTEHFSVHDTLIEARASIKSIRPKSPGDSSDQPPMGGWDVTRMRTSMDRSGRTPRMARAPIRRLGSKRRGRANRPSSDSWEMV